SRRRHTSFSRDWSSDVCSSDLVESCQEGAGVTARVDGVVVHVGTGAYLARSGVDVTTLTGLANEMAQRGSTPVLVAVDRVAAGRSEERRVGKEGIWKC